MNCQWSPTYPVGSFLPFYNYFGCPRLAFGDYVCGEKGAVKTELSYRNDARKVSLFAAHIDPGPKGQRLRNEDCTQKISEERAFGFKTGFSKLIWKSLKSKT